ncbi:anti-sigma factor [Nocardia sp. CNY236]|uniref:anti-sigma factor family protein n=1 Tax=Nocardia sp. CNY236 TaxID=1169152 RepID=UPI0004025E1F|nr:zf-HC2 domain-containing protein [Nocardia sp. CNY236]
MTDIADDYAMWDASYVLGSLSRDERQEYEGHLAVCADCRTSVAELAGLPGLMAMVDTETALSMIEPPPEVAESVPEPAAPAPQTSSPRMLPRLVAATERRRRRSRWVSVGAAVAAAAAAVAIAVPIAVTVSDTTESDGVSQQVFAERRMDPLSPTPVTASFKLIPDGNMTRVVMSCSYGPSEQKYNWNFALYVTHADGRQQQLAQWPAGPGTELTFDRTVDDTPDQIRSVEIRTVKTGAVVLMGRV